MLLGEPCFGAKSVVSLTSPGAWSCCSIPGSTNSTTSSTVPGKWVWALREYPLFLGAVRKALSGVLWLCRLGPSWAPGPESEMPHVGWCLLILPFEGTLQEPGLSQAVCAPLSLPHVLQENHHCPRLLP